MARSRKRKRNGVTVRPPGAPVIHTPPSNVQHATQQRVSARFEQYSGQVPHPDHARAFEDILPGSFDRFVTMAEDQGGHRRWMEKAFLLLGGISQLGGVVIAGALILAGMYYGHDLLMHDKDIQGFAVMLTPLGIVGATFFGVRKAQGSEKSRKAIAERG